MAALATREGLVHAGNVPELSRAVREMSDFYNARGGARPKPKDELAARLAFWFARDVQKGAMAVAELLGAGLLGPEAKVLDVGAGLGAMTWGLAHAIHARHGRADVRATWVDADERALALAKKLRDAWPTPEGLSLRAQVEASRADSPRGTFDVVLVGQVLSEMDQELDAPARVTRHADFLGELLRTRVSDRGSLVVVEPALSVRARHLHAVRDAMLATKGAHVFAPCVHEAPCPALAAPKEWCHEDREISLPDWLVPVARGAGLRFEGLTWSYLVLRKDGANVRDTFASDAAACGRAVSGRLRSKGKEECIVCGPVPVLRKLYRIDREASAENAAWESLARGTLVSDVGENKRVRSETHLRVLDPSDLPLAPPTPGASETS